MDDIKLDISAKLDKMMADAMTESFTEQVGRPGNFKSPLTVEGLTAIFNRFQRESGRFYVLSTEHLPDDCYGIIYMRPEDAATMKAAQASKDKSDGG